jgi:hypothetical protein
VSKKSDLSIAYGKRSGKSMETTTKTNQDSPYVITSTTPLVCETCGSQKVKVQDDGVHCKECGCIMNEKTTVKPAGTKKIGQTRLI